MTLRNDTEHRLIRVAPPIRGELHGRPGRDLHYFIASPHYYGYKFWKLRWPLLNLIYSPFPLYIRLIPEEKQPSFDTDPVIEQITGDELQIVAWADLCRSFNQALKVMLENWKQNPPQRVG